MKAKKQKIPTALAYCFAGGQIEFTDSKCPDGALPLARGPAKKLRDFIDGLARHGYQTREVEGRPTKIPGTDCLLVPGVPEAADQFKGVDAMRAWLDWIKPHAPAGVTVN